MLHQPSGDGKAQPRAAVLARSRHICLRKDVENEILLGFRDTHARILDGNFQHYLALCSGPDKHLRYHMAQRGELERVAEQVHQNLLQPGGVAHHPPGHVRRNIQNDLQPLARSLRAHHAMHALQQGFRTELYVFQFQMPRFYFGEVQNIVDEVHEQQAGIAQQFQIPGLLLRKLRCLQHVHKSQHGVHGGAYLVAHGGKKTALGPAGIFRRLARLVQGLFHRQPRGDIAHHAQYGLLPHVEHLAVVYLGRERGTLYRQYAYLEPAACQPRARRGLAHGIQHLQHLAAVFRPCQVQNAHFHQPLPVAAHLRQRL